MNKKSVRLTENDLHRIVKKSVNKILKENAYESDGVWDALDQLRNCMDDQTIIERIISRLGSYHAAKILNDIIATECPEEA